ALTGLEALARAVAAAQAAHDEAVRRLVEFLEFDQAARFDGEGGLADLPFEDQDRLLDVWLRTIRSLGALVAFNHLAGRCRGEDLAGVVAWAETWPEAGRFLTSVFRRQRLEGLL